MDNHTCIGATPETSYMNIFVSSMLDIVLKKCSNISEDQHTHLFNLFSDLTNSAMRDMKSRFTTYSEHAADLLHDGVFNRKADTFRSSVLCVERLIMHHFRQRSTSFIDPEMADGSDRFGTSDAPQLALNECREAIISKLNIERTSVLDELVGSGFISDSERESIITKHTTKAKLEDFYRLVHGRITIEQLNTILLPAIAKEHPWLAKQITHAMKHVSEIKDITQSTCVCCRMKDEVEVKRIAEPLLNSGLVSLAQHADLTNPAIPNNSKCQQVLKSGKPELEMYNLVVSSLEQTYPNLFNDFEIQKPMSFDCFCLTLISNLEINSGTGGNDYSSSNDIAKMTDIMSSLSCINVPAVYKTRSATRNLCVILTNSAYRHLIGQASVELSAVHGMDTANIQRCFEKLHFDCEIHRNKKGAEIVSIFQRLSSREDLVDVGCLAVFVLAITVAEDVMGVDGVRIPFSHIKALFHTSSCPAMAGRPKLFFIQTSRGVNNDNGMLVPHDRDNPLSPWSVIPDDADFFVGYSTASGCMSYGIPKKGSIYISTLVDVLDKHSQRLDFLSCMQLVNNDMANFNLDSGTAIHKQIAFPMFSLRKQVLLGREDVFTSSDKTSLVGSSYVSSWTMLS